MENDGQTEIKDLLKKIPNKKLVSIYKQYPSLCSQTVVKNYLKYGELDLKPFVEAGLQYREIMKTFDHSVYTGQVDNKNRRHGLGILVINDQSLYVGYSKASFSKGQGRLFSFNGNVYEGSWKINQLKGEAIIYFADGRVYKGDTVLNVPHGFGFLELPGSWKYSGEFFEGFKQGEGRLSYENGNSYSGGFFKDKMKGQGVLEYKDGVYYKGEMKNNKINGKGLLKYKDLYQYEGDFVDGTKDGFGEITYKSGKKYSGYWRNDKPDGKGTEIKPDGLEVEGCWRNGTLVECYNDAFDDPFDQYAAFHKKGLPSEVDELLEKIKAFRAGFKYKNEVKNFEEIEDPEPAAIIKPPAKKYSEIEILACLRELSSITVSHSLYTESLKVYLKLENFDFFDGDFVKLKTRFVNEWDQVGEDGGVYKGERDKRNVIQGRGVLLESGKIFQGFFAKNKKNGIGREINPDGSYFEGYWINDKKNGFGIEKNAIGLYSGDWFQDKRKGLGVLKTKEWKYHGEWDNGLQEGYGEIFYKDKKKFKGDFHQGLQEGFGCLVVKNGEAITGLWKKGVFVSNESEILTTKTDEVQDISHTFDVPMEYSRLSKVSEYVPYSRPPSEMSKISRWTVEGKERTDTERTVENLDSRNSFIKNGFLSSPRYSPGTFSVNESEAYLYKSTQIRQSPSVSKFSVPNEKSTFDFKRYKRTEFNQRTFQEKNENITFEESKYSLAVEK